MFCVECGEEKPIYKNGVCIDCYLKSKQFTEGPDVLHLPFCAHCESYKYKNTWIKDAVENVIVRLVKNAFKISNELTDVNITPECELIDKTLECNIIISAMINDNKIVEQHKVKIILKKTVCDVCSKRFGGYHEAILQIRTDERKLSKKELEKIITFVENQVKIMQENGNRGLFITDMGKEGNGYDFFLSDKSAAFSIAKKVQEEFGGIIKQSSSNIGMKDSKQIYRMTYLIRLPFYKKGMFILFEKSLYKIQSLHGSKIKVIDLSNWKEVNLDEKQIHKASVLNDVSEIDMIVVSQNDKEIQVMHPDSFKLFIIKKPITKGFDKEKITVLRIDDKLFVSPKE